ncbi:hypothetical protein Hsw_PB0012 (plasmid) [Hymenobacter swuensis DY53]|uniref:Uncharacterized protein n=1 Tax=Hymenobacter swuensis DY53 TaxID=1227739 RepID=W8EU44_9BACT|nr:hypothetical protein Hsw_PB0012 [Hymenobacter swuensis DY53]
MEFTPHLATLLGTVKRNAGLLRAGRRFEEVGGETPNLLPYEEAA